ncbi:hypothetical protein [uncultured Microbacterium sp.]|uniref:hypothetical protein n=1 Tax=uncultured Microbacterium sp. TaxID=191216 RepID=UPI0025F376FA|nr:hypothetical protein [uncultured Microbacterium sp.]
MSETQDWERELIEEQEALEADALVKNVAIILLTRDLTGTPWLDWDVWCEQSSDDDRLDALRTASVVVEHIRADRTVGLEGER